MNGKLLNLGYKILYCILLIILLISCKKEPDIKQKVINNWQEYEFNSSYINEEYEFSISSRLIEDSDYKEIIFSKFNTDIIINGFSVKEDKVYLKLIFDATWNINQGVVMSPVGIELQSGSIKTINNIIECKINNNESDDIKVFCSQIGGITSGGYEISLFKKDIMDNKEISIAMPGYYKIQYKIK